MSMTQLENELQWAKVWTRAVRERLELFCQQPWSLTGSGKVRERPWGSLSLPVLALMGRCGPRAFAETFTQACCSRVLSPWKGQVGLVLSLFMRQMIDTCWAQAPALCFLPWVVSLQQNGLQCLCPSASRSGLCDLCTWTSRRRLQVHRRLLPLQCPFSQPFSAASSPFPSLLLYPCVWGNTYLLNEWGNSTYNFRHR